MGSWAEQRGGTKQRQPCAFPVWALAPEPRLFSRAQSCCLSFCLHSPAQRKRSSTVRSSLYKLNLYLLSNLITHSDHHRTHNQPYKLSATSTQPRPRFYLQQAVLQLPPRCLHPPRRRRRSSSRLPTTPTSLSSARWPSAPSSSRTCWRILVVTTPRPFLFPTYVAPPSTQ